MADSPKTRKELTQEITGVQVATSLATNELTNPLPKSYDTYRAIRKDPTVALARALIVAPAVAAEWAVESDEDVDDERVEFIRDQLFRHRETIVESAMSFGHVDYGWCGYEKVFAVEGGRIVLKKVKQLLHDLTEIVVKPNGDFNGFVQTTQIGTEVFVPVERALNMPFRVEGTNWYGSGLLENVRPIYNRWTEADAGAQRYDKKIAGSHWVVKYPIGMSIYNGTETDNAEIAKNILNTLESSGSVSIPLTKQVNDFNGENPDWEIELKSDSDARQHSFVERLSYLDKKKVRALLVPERAITEGQFGTKAEAGEHADMSLLNVDLQHRRIVSLLNRNVVDQLLALNWGEDARGTVRLVASSLDSDAEAFLRDIYKVVLANPTGFIEELERLDLDAVKDSLGVPKVAQVDAPSRRESPEGIGEEGERALSMLRGLYEKGKSNAV